MLRFHTRLGSATKPRRPRTSLAIGVETLEPRIALSGPGGGGSTSSSGADPYVAGNALGETVAVYGSSTDVYYEKVNSGSPGAPVHVTNNAGTSLTSAPLGVAIDGSGDFVILYITTNSSGTTGAGTFLQRYGWSGNPLGSPVSVVRPILVKGVDLAMNASGQLVIGWSPMGDGAPEYAVAQRYNADMSKYGDDITLFANTNYMFADSVQVGIDASGDFVAAYHLHGSDGTIAATPISSVFEQRFTWAGSASPVALVNTNTNPTSSPTVSMNASGQFVVAWVDQIAPNSNFDVYSVVEQQYDSTGTAVGGNVVAHAGQTGTSTEGPEQIFYPDIALDDSGSFVITYGDIPENSTHTYINASSSTLSAASTPAGFTTTYIGDPGSAPSFAKHPRVAVGAEGHFTIVYFANLPTNQPVVGYYY